MLRVALPSLIPEHAFPVEPPLPHNLGVRSLPALRVRLEELGAQHLLVLPGSPGACTNVTICFCVVILDLGKRMGEGLRQSSTPISWGARKMMMRTTVRVSMANSQMNVPLGVKARPAMRPYVRSMSLSSLPGCPHVFGFRVGLIFSFRMEVGGRGIYVHASAFFDDSAHVESFIRDVVPCVWEPILLFPLPLLASLFSSL